MLWKLISQFKSTFFSLIFFFFKSHALLENTNCLCYISYLTYSCAKYPSMNNQGSLWNPVYNRKKVTDPTLKKSGSWNKNLVVQEERMTRGCNTQMGEDRVGGPFCFWECFSVYTLFHLYHVTVWCLCRAQRGLTKRVKHGERERPSREWSQKIYFSPVQKPVLQARTIQPVEKETERDRQGQVGRECWGLMTQ